MMKATLKLVQTMRNVKKEEYERFKEKCLNYIQSHELSQVTKETQFKENNVTTVRASTFFSFLRKTRLTNTSSENNIFLGLISSSNSMVADVLKKKNILTIADSSSKVKPNNPRFSHCVGTTFTPQT